MNGLVGGRVGGWVDGGRKEEKNEGKQDVPLPMAPPTKFSASVLYWGLRVCLYSINCVR